MYIFPLNVTLIQWIMHYRIHFRNKVNGMNEMKMLYNLQWACGFYIIMRYKVLQDKLDLYLTWDMKVYLMPIDLQSL
jgi:hypothetical protein